MARPGRLRVVSGTARGRQIRAPEGAETRPTTNRVREAVFNALYSLGAVEGARVLDLFAGSGALGIEALSRGAAHASFVESAATARAILEENLSGLGFSDRVTVIGGEVNEVLAELSADIDLVFADPPYAFDRWPDLMSGLARLVVPGGVAVLESDRSVEVGQSWKKMRERTYGGTVITFVITSPPTQPTGADA